MSGHDAREPQRLVSEIMNQVAEDQAVLQEMEAQRGSKSRRGLLIGLTAALGLVLVWDAWVIFWRAPGEPPAEHQVCALMRSAGALALEIHLFQAEEARLPTAEEMGYVLDDDLSYQPRADGFAVTNTDGERVVTYDGAQAVQEWLGAAGCAMPGRAAP